MARNKKRKESKQVQSPVTTKIQSKKVVVETKASEEELFPFEQYSLDKLSDFLRADGQIIAVAWKIPTERVGMEEVIKEHKNMMIKKIIEAGEQRGILPDPAKIVMKAIPLGSETLIKAYFKVSDSVGGKRSPVAKQDATLPKKMPSEGLFEMET